MIELKDIKKTYGKLTALDVEYLEIKAGESFGLVGNNGAGKTTMFRLLLDLTKPTNGKALSKMQTIQQSEHWKHYTGSYLDENFLIDFLTPEEYFEFVGKINGKNKEDLDIFYKEFEDFFNGEVLQKNKYIRDFSKGNQKKIGIAAAILPKPEILILDEPFANLDPTTQIRLKKMLKNLKENENTTMLISSHDLNHVIEVCERIVVLENGKIIHDKKTDSDTLKQLEDYFNN